MNISYKLCQCKHIGYWLDDALGD